MFEAIQDVAVYDASDNPKQVKIYQIKKKDRNEWGWNDLTGLKLIPKKISSRTKAQPFVDTPNSIIGRLYASVREIKEVEASGHFVSNVGCNLILDGGANAATSVAPSLSTLSPEYLELLVQGLVTMHESGEPSPSLENIYVEKINIPVDDPGTYLVGEVHDFLQKRSPAHANQARSLVDALLAKIGPLGAKTDKCKSFDQLKSRQGFSKKEFDFVLSEVATVPDFLDLLNDWLRQLQEEGLTAIEVTAIKAAAANVYKNQLLDTQDEAILDLERTCDDWIEKNPVPASLKTYFETAFTNLSVKFSDVRQHTIYAVFALRAIKSCVDQI